MVLQDITQFKRVSIIKFLFYIDKYAFNAYNKDVKKRKKGGSYLKRADLIRLLEKNGWYLLRNGSNHDIYTNGVKKETIPRHREIPEGLAKTIIKRVGI